MEVGRGFMSGSGGTGQGDSAQQADGAEHADSADMAGRGDQAGGPEGRVGPFVTFVEHRRPDGHLARWESRRHRKHLGGGPVTGSTWWAPKARGWWIAVLFAVGSLLFALGAVPSYVDAVGTSWDGVTFFAGSLFFTYAGFLTYREAADATPPVPGAPRRRIFVLAPRRIAWWATAVQL